MDIDAEGTVEPPVLNVDDGGSGREGSEGKDDDKVRLVCFVFVYVLLYEIFKSSPASTSIN